MKQIFCIFKKLGNNRVREKKKKNSLNTPNNSLFDACAVKLIFGVPSMCQFSFIPSLFNFQKMCKAFDKSWHLKILITMENEWVVKWSQPYSNSHSFHSKDKPTHHMFSLKYIEFNG
jgi:hypothetical protein